MSPQVLEEQWYQALLDGDCVCVMELLNKDSSLLNLRWKENNSREIKGPDYLGHQSFETLKGRNALHVAALRGCVELVEQVLILCNLTEITTYSRVGEPGASAECNLGREDIAAATPGQLYLAESDESKTGGGFPAVILGQLDLAESKGAERNDHNFTGGDDSACEVGHQCEQERGEAEEEISPADADPPVSTRDFSSQQFDERLEPAQVTPAHRNSEVEDGNVIRPQSPFARLGRELSEGRENSSRASGSYSPKPLIPFPGLVERHLARDFSTTSGNSVSSQDLRELLLAKDGYFGLEPIAMAGLHFNVEIMALLAYSYKKCAIYTHSETDLISHGRLVYRDDQQNRQYLVQLSNATKEVMSNLKSDEPVAYKLCVAQYRKDRDFNFLPIEVYLFHFSCASGAWLLGKELWKRVRAYRGELWRFLLELKDGRGRTPTHAVLDSNLSLQWLVTYVLCDGEDEEVIVCALTTPDTASRTPAHRAATMGHSYNGVFESAAMRHSSHLQLVDILDYARKYDEVSAVSKGKAQLDMREWVPYRDQAFNEYYRFAVSILEHCVGEIPILERHVGETGRFQFQRSHKPLQAAILTRNYDCAKLLVEASFECYEEDSFYRPSHFDNNIYQVLGIHLDDQDSLRADVKRIQWDTMEFACLVGADCDFIDFLKKKKVAEPKTILQQDSEDAFDDDPVKRDYLFGCLTSWQKVKVPTKILQKDTQATSCGFLGTKARFLTSWQKKKVAEPTSILQQDSRVPSCTFLGWSIEVIGVRKGAGPQNRVPAGYPRYRLAFHGKRSWSPAKNRWVQPRWGFVVSKIDSSQATTKACDPRNPFPALHLVAALGDVELLKLFLKDPCYDPFVEDYEGNTALHHAMMVKRFEFRPFFLDYVSCEHFRFCRQNANGASWKKSQEDKNTVDENRSVGRQGCINLLLQVGCDVFKVNKRKEVPYPQGSLSSSAKFLSWWHDKQGKEFEATQNNLNFATNAISVTATLVATASYVGPFQPPMGYSGDPNQLQDQNIWVLFFIACDTISFYLAIAAITFSLIPSLPVPQQSMSVELQRTRRMVTLAVAILFPAIIFVLLAFGSSSIAVLSASITSSTGGGIAIATTTVGGLLCLVAFSLFFIRLIAILFPRNSRVRYLYEVTSI